MNQKNEPRAAGNGATAQNRVCSRISYAPPTDAAIARAKDELKVFADIVFAPGDVVEVRRLPGGRSTWHKAETLAEQAEALAIENARGGNVYAGVNPRCRAGGTTERDIWTCRVVFADFDGCAPEDAVNRWLAAALPCPSLVVATGHGAHVYLKLTNPMDPLWWRKFQQRIALAVGSDRAVSDPPRIVRLPGFQNWKDPAAPAFVVSADPASAIESQDLNTILKQLPKPKAWPSNLPAGLDAAIEKLHGTAAPLMVLSRAAAYAARAENVSGPAGGRPGGRNPAAFRLACAIRRGFALDEQSALTILRVWNANNRPPLSDDELRRCVENAGRYSKGPVGALRDAPRPAPIWTPCFSTEALDAVKGGAW